MKAAKPASDGPSSVARALSELRSVEGFVAACVFDADAGALLGEEPGVGGLDLAVASAGNSELVRAKRTTIESLGMDDTIEDIVITLGRQYHLIRPLRSRPGVFFYIALDRSRANLAMARIRVAEAERTSGI